MIRPTSSSIQDLTTLDLLTVRDRLLDLLTQEAYREGDFLLSSGQRSPYYINGKQVTLHPQGAVMVGRLLLSRLPADCQAVAGLTLGADPLVMAVSMAGAYCDRTITPLIIRKEAKGHGTSAYIEGPTLPAGTAVIVLEDVVTTGQSAWKAVERLRLAGYQSDRVLAVVDRQQGGAEFYAEQGLTFEALLTIADIQARWAELSHSGQVESSHD